jgi:hypothetical protein
MLKGCASPCQRGDAHRKLLYICICAPIVVIEVCAPREVGATVRKSEEQSNRSVSVARSLKPQVCRDVTHHRTL